MVQSADNVMSVLVPIVIANTAKCCISDDPKNDLDIMAKYKVSLHIDIIDNYSPGCIHCQQATDLLNYYAQ